MTETATVTAAPSGRGCLHPGEAGFDAMYAAIASRDTRFDGVFYTAVASTGIYCRPSCPAPRPAARHVSFYRSAAAAQQAGYRACLRCIPDAVPGSPLWHVPGTVAARALALIDAGIVDAEGVPGLATRLGYSVRTVNRLLTAETGAGALAHARARRAHTAHQLITGTDLPLTDIAFASGFGSVRQFNDTIRACFGDSPRGIRSRGARPGTSSPGMLRAELPYRRPFDFNGLLQWFAPRAIEGVEVVTEHSYARTLRAGSGRAAAVEVSDLPRRGRLQVLLRLDDLRDFADVESSRCGACSISTRTRSRSMPPCPLTRRWPIWSPNGRGRGCRGPST